MKKKFFIFLAILIILSFIPISSLYATSTSISYIGAAWNHNDLTVYISLQKGVDPTYRDEAIVALNDWKGLLGISFSYHLVNYTPSKKNPVDISIEIKKNTGAVLGSTKISSSSGTMNSTSITMASQNAMGKPLDRDDFKNILRHELGNAFGLGHSNDNGTPPVDLMYAYYDYTTVGYAVMPSIDLDIAALLHLYNTGNGFAGTTLTKMPTVFP